MTASVPMSVGAALGASVGLRKQKVIIA
jgi:hypothetical protein